MLALKGNSNNSGTLETSKVHASKTFLFFYIEIRSVIKHNEMHKAIATVIYSTAKETRKFVTFKMFEYLICSIPEFYI